MNVADTGLTLDGKQPTTHWTTWQQKERTGSCLITTPTTDALQHCCGRRVTACPITCPCTTASPASTKQTTHCSQATDHTTTLCQWVRQPLLQIGGHYYNIQVTYLYTLSDDPNDPHYWNDSHTGGGDREPTGINNKPAPEISNIDTVCALMLYRDSATNSADGWDTNRLCPARHPPGPVLRQCITHGQPSGVAGQLQPGTIPYDNTTDYPTDTATTTHQLPACGRFESNVPVGQCTLPLHLHQPAHAQDAGSRGHAGSRRQIHHHNEARNQVVKVADDKMKYGYIWKW